MEKFRWGYIGNGGIAYSTARNITSGNHAVTAVYGRNKEKAQVFAKRFNAKYFSSADEMLESGIIDGIYIATPHTAHVDYAVQCLAAGIPVLCEKPVGVSCVDVDRLINAAETNKTYFTEAMWTWFSPVAHKVREWVKDGHIGEVQSIKMDYAFPGILKSKTSRVRMPETAGGALLDIGIYPITYCYNLLGYPDTIICEGEIEDGIDVAEKILLYYGDTRCEINLSLKKAVEKCSIVGREGKIKLPLFHMASRATLVKGWKREIFKGKTDYLTEFTEAANEIKNGKTQSAFIPFSATRDCMKIMDECRRQMGLVYPFEE